MTRRAFFSFHYEPDIYRVNVVRNSGLTHDVDSRDSFFDGGLWESAKSKNDDSLKTLIRTGMAGNSVVCVLAGSSTWARRWVRYEIARAVVEERGLVTVHINNIICMKALAPSVRGLNPLSFMGLYRPDARQVYYLAEWANGRWQSYADYTLAVPVPKFSPMIAPGTICELNFGTREYDYQLQNGYQNLPGWLEDAAIAVGRE